MNRYEIVEIVEVEEEDIKEEMKKCRDEVEEV